MTKDEFKKKFINNGSLAWDKIGEIDFDFMYNHLHFIDSIVAELFEVPIELVVKKRLELGTSIKKEDYIIFESYKQQGYLEWDKLNYQRFYYLYNKCKFSDGLIAELFDVPKRKVTTKRKELGITMFDSVFDALWVEKALKDVSSYLDLVNTESPKS